NLRTICLKHKPELKDDVRPLTPAAFAVLLLSIMLAGCIGGNLENDFVYPDDVWYASTNATIVEVWEDGELVETNYPVLSFDFNESNAPSPFVAYSVRGVLVDETVDASQTTVVEVEFQHHGLHTLQLIADYQDTPDERGNDSRHLNDIVVRIEKRIEWRESSTNEPMPMPLDTRRESGDVPASVIVIESTVSNPELINNIGGGQDVEVSWQLIDNTQEACQSQPGTVEEGGTATWKTVHFNTDEVHELRVNYEEGQDAIDVEQTILIQYEHLEDAPNA
ncbi:MAG: hypothetical protein ACPG7K_04835, partial [Poseidonia sp.]